MEFPYFLPTAATNARLRQTFDLDHDDVLGEPFPRVLQGGFKSCPVVTNNSRPHAAEWTSTGQTVEWMAGHFRSFRARFSAVLRAPPEGIRMQCNGYAVRSGMKILAISDAVEPFLYGASLPGYTSGIEAVVSCGDLPFEYLEFVVTCSGTPLYYVRGNHDPDEDAKAPEGCVPLDGRVVDAGGGLVLAGLSGTRWYSGGPNQYAGRAMRRKAWALSTGVALRGLAGRGRPNVFVSHAPPLGLGDRGDPAHKGFEPFLRLIDRHEPELWLHGHVHLYGPQEKENRETRRGGTRVVNVYGHRVLEVAGGRGGL